MINQAQNSNLLFNNEIHNPIQPQSMELTYIRP